jgi:polyferredoxin
LPTPDSPPPRPRQAAKPYAWGPRNSFALAVLLLTLAVGVQFYFFLEQVAGPGPVSVQRPPGVEGFLPIGAMMGWKLFAQTGYWDRVHPAAMVILGWAGLVSLALRKSFCSWFCPVGTVSEWCWKAGRKILGRNFAPPRWLDIPLRGIKYLLLGFFLWVIWRMSAPAVAAFLQGPYYQVSDVKMLHFFTRMTPLTAAVLAVLTGLSFLIRNFWCRYLCPYGALMGLLALASPTRIERNSQSCTGCGRCGEVCPHRLPVQAKQRILSAECSGCLDCTRVCPVADTLGMNSVGPGRWTWRPAALGLAVGLSFCAAVWAAELSGHWQSSLPAARVRILMKALDSPVLKHPSVGGVN